MEAIFVGVICSLILGIIPWLLKGNDINIENIMALKKWNHNNVVRFARIVLFNT